MATTANGPPSHLRAAQALAFAVLVLAYVGGVYHAWRALHIARHSLPTAAVQELGAALPPPPQPSRPHASLCNTAPRVHCTLLPAGPSQGDEPALDVHTLVTRYLEPALSLLADAPWVTSSVLLHPPPLPEPQLRWCARRQAHVLPSTAAAVWVRQLQQLAWSTSAAHDDGSLGAAPAQVLLFAAPAAHQPLTLEHAGGEISTGMQLADGTLLLVVNQHATNGSAGGSNGGDPAGSREERSAAAILSWLLPQLEPLAGSGSSDVGILQRLRRSVTAACGGGALELLQRFVGAMAAAPDQPVTAAMVGRAAEVVRLLRTLAAEQQRQRQRQHGSDGDEALAADATALASARRAWALAHQLLHDPGTGAHQAFPSEHALAVLLPVALPVTLVLVQAAGRKVATWRGQSRRHSSIA